MVSVLPEHGALSKHTHIFISYDIEIIVHMMEINTVTHVTVMTLAGGATVVGVAYVNNLFFKFLKSD